MVFPIESDSAYLALENIFKPAIIFTENLQCFVLYWISDNATFVSSVLVTVYYIKTYIDLI